MLQAIIISAVVGIIVVDLIYTLIVWVLRHIARETKMVSTLKIVHFCNGVKIDEYHYSIPITNTGQNRTLTIAFNGETPCVVFWPPVESIGE